MVKSIYLNHKGLVLNTKPKYLTIIKSELNLNRICRQSI